MDKMFSLIDSTEEMRSSEKAKEVEVIYEEIQDLLTVLCDEYPDEFNTHPEWINVDQESSSLLCDHRSLEERKVEMIKIRSMLKKAIDDVKG